MIKKEFADLFQEFCDEHTHPDVLYRLDTVEIDLGKINPETLEQDFIKLVRLSLFETMINNIKPFAREKNGKKAPDKELMTKSGLELLNFFLKTGNLPWWADSGDAGVLDRHFSKFIKNAGEKQVYDWVGNLRTNPGVVERFIRNISDTNLFSTVEKVSGNEARQFLELLFKFLNTRIDQIPSLSRHAASPVKNRIISWLFVFFELEKGKSAFRKDDLAVNYFLHLSSALNVPSRTVFRDLEVLSEQGKLPKTLFPGGLTRIERVSKTTNEETPIKPSENETLTLKAVLAKVFGQLVSSVDNMDKIFSELPLSDLSDKRKEDAFQTFISQLGLIKQIIENDRQREDEIAGFPKDIRKKIEYFEKLLAGLPEVYGQKKGPMQFSKTPVSGDLKTRIETLSALAIDLSEHLNRPEDTIRGRKVKKLLKSSLKTEEDVYVKNSGLVLIAPFLKLFFKHLGLTEDDEFISEEARFKAIHLLHFISFGEENTLEFLLPLNKLLCGLDVSDLTEIDTSLTEEEKAECANLIRAVINHVPSFNNMTVDGFRGSFILRNGIISTRDRNWLLQVERQTYDVVLEQVPWSYNIVKLPWMDKLIYVEWQIS